MESLPERMQMRVEEPGALEEEQMSLCQRNESIRGGLPLVPGDALGISARSLAIYSESLTAPTRAVCA